MGSLRDEIRAKQQAALKSGASVELSTLRLLWSAIRNEEIKLQHQLTEAEVQTVVAREIKQLTDAAAEFERGGRADLVEKNRAEIALLSAYLPPALSEAELETIIRRLIAESGAKDQANLGPLMGLVMKEVKGRADGNRVRALVSRLLSGTTS